MTFHVASVVITLASIALYSNTLPPMTPLEAVTIAYDEAREIRDFVENFDSDDPTEVRDALLAKLLQVDLALDSAVEMSDGCFEDVRRGIRLQKKAIKQVMEEGFILWDRTQAGEQFEHDDILVDKVRQVIDMKVKLIFFIAEKGFCLDRR